MSPVVPETEEELLILRDFVGDNVCWVGFHRTNGVYLDYFGRKLQPNQTWMEGIRIEDEEFEDQLCFVISSDGLNSRACNKKANFVCQYTP